MKIEKKSIFYHGTLNRHAISIMNWGVSARINAFYELDFGSGFYISDSKKFAKYHANELHKNCIIPSQDEFLDLPVIMELEINLPGFLRDYTSQIFKFKTWSFLKYVFTCRINCDDIKHPCFSKDIVCGPMADGNLTDSISYYNKKPSKFRKLVVYWNFLLPHPKYRTQVVLRNQEICDTIKIRKITTTKGDVLYDAKARNES